MHRTVWATDVSYWLRRTLTYLSPENKKPQRSRLMMSMKHVPFGILVSSASADKFGTWNKWYWRSFPSFLKPLAGAQNLAGKPYFLQGSWLILLWRVVDQALRRHRARWFHRFHCTRAAGGFKMRIKLSKPTSHPKTKVNSSQWSRLGDVVLSADSVVGLLYCFPIHFPPLFQWLSKQLPKQPSRHIRSPI